MADKKKTDIFFVLGWVVGLAFLLDLAANLGDPFEFLWYCSFSAFLLTIGLFRKNRLLITMIFVLSVPAQSLWILDFILQSLGHGMGRTATFLSTAGPLVFWTALLLHVLLIPVSWYGVWKLGFYPKALGGILLYIICLLTASFFLTPPEFNHNCVFYPCDALDPGGEYGRYFLVHGLVLWSAIMTLNFFLMKFLFRHRLAGKNK